MFWVHLKLPKQARSIKDLGLIQLQVSINQTSLASKKAAEFKWQKKAFDIILFFDDKFLRQKERNSF